MFYIYRNEVNKSLIRNKLSSITNEFLEILKTYQYDLINPFHFLQWKSENRKRVIVLFHHIEVPVSKTYQKDVKAILNSNTE